MSEKPEALRLANDLEAFYRLTGEGGMDAQAADELLEQHAKIEALKAENERLRDALKLALNSHGRMLLTDPPQDPWKVNRVDEVIRELLQEVPR